MEHTDHHMTSTSSYSHLIKKFTQRAFATIQSESTNPIQVSTILFRLFLFKEIFGVANADSLIKSSHDQYFRSDFLRNRKFKYLNSNPVEYDTELDTDKKINFLIMVTFALK